MSTVGYYRYKTLADSDRDVIIYINSVPYVKSIKTIDVCDGFKLLKFLNKSGQYRFYPFSNYYQTKDLPELIGTTNKFITSILTDMSNRQNIGYKNERTLLLTADVSKDELEILQDIYTSPRVYLYVGTNNSDLPNDWIEVTVKVSDAIVRRPKGDYGRIDLTITLPEWFSIKMI
jgi:hypothetical protein